MFIWDTALNNTLTVTYNYPGDNSQTHRIIMIVNDVATGKLTSASKRLFAIDEAARARLTTRSTKAPLSRCYA